MKICFFLAATIIFSCKNELKVVLTDIVPDKTEHQYNYTAVIYLDGKGCTSCALQNLRPWARHKQILEKYNTNILLVINHFNEQVILETLKNLDIFNAFNVVFDKDGKFRTMNSNVFKIAHDGIFIYNEDKDVIFTGSPIATEEKWNIFIKLVKH